MILIKVPRYFLGRWVDLQKEPDKGDSYRLLPSLCSDLFIKPYLKTSSSLNWDGGEVWRRAEREKWGGTERCVWGGILYGQWGARWRNNWGERNTETQRQWKQKDWAFLPTGSDCLLVLMLKSFFLSKLLSRQCDAFMFTKYVKMCKVKCFYL